jgi:hypothetical protein
LSRDVFRSRESQPFVCPDDSFACERAQSEALKRSSEKEKNMVTITIKGGTPEGYESLCKTCTRGHIISGFRATEEEVFCRTFYIEREIRFPVRECTFYEDRRLASKEDMEEIAWRLRSTTGKPTRNFGFVSGANLSELESEDPEILSTANDSTESTK